MIEGLKGASAKETEQPLALQVNPTRQSKAWLLPELRQSNTSSRSVTAFAVGHAPRRTNWSVSVPRTRICAAT